MKYLELFKNFGADTTYNFFIPDMRNSGKSPPTKTYMGYKFADDLMASLMYLKHTKGQSEFILYGFSMGALSVFIVAGIDAFQIQLLENGIAIKKIIGDSPLSNVREILLQNSVEMGLPNFLFNATFRLYDHKINGFANKMNIRSLVPNIEIPILILQTEDDVKTPVQILREEIEHLKRQENLEVHFFKGPAHVKIYQTDSLKDKYAEIVSRFIRN